MTQMLSPHHPGSAAFSTLLRRGFLLGAATGLMALAGACSGGATDKSAEAPAADKAATSAAPGDPAAKQAALDKALATAPAKASVADGADVLPPEVEGKIAEKLKAVEAKSGHPMAVVTVKSLGGVEAADYAAALARKWELGRPGYGDGLLLLVAPDDKQMTLDRGIGLDAALSKEAAQKLIDQTMIPQFKTGNFAGGIEAGAVAIADLLAAIPNDTRANVEAAKVAADKKAAAAIEAATKGQ